jgi:trigger factor
MKITLIKTENHMTYLTIEAEETDMETYLEKVYQRLLKRVEVPGFNRGTAPRDVLERHVGRDKMVEEAIKEMVPVAHSQAIKEYKFQTEMQPIVRTLQKDPAAFEMVIPLKPVIKLCDYHHLKIEPESLDITDEEVKIVIEGLCKQCARFSSVDRPVREGDELIIDIKGEIADISFINQKGIRFKVAPEYTADLPGLYKETIGMTKGEEKEFKLRFPGNFVRKEVAGKEATCKVKVNDILETELPEINDELANVIAPGVKTLEALKERVRVNMRREREENAQPRFENKLMDTMIRTSQLEYPPVMVEMETQGLINQCKQEIRASCSDDKEYQEKLKQTPDNILKERAWPLAEKRIKWSLVINEVSKAENIEVDDKEIDEEIESMIVDAGEAKEEQRVYLNDGQNRQNVRDIVKARKIIKKLTEIVKNNN